MVRVVAAAAACVVLASCAPGKPVKLERPKRMTRPNARDYKPLFVARPQLQLATPTPDFHDELRWPLSSMSHPALEPKLDIASHFANPGIGWMELCSRGVQNTTGRNKEMIAYLRGWCAAVKGDPNTACASLAPLLGSTTSGLNAAVRADLANILANDHADKAAHLIKAHNIRDVAVLDLLSANYAEVGTAPEALAFNYEAMASDDYANAATKCTRLTKAIVLSRNKTSAESLELETMVKTGVQPDPTCVRLYRKVSCWHDRGDCGGFYADEGLTRALSSLADAYFEWPHGQSQRHWLDIADKAFSAVPIPGSRDVAFAAVENAIRAEFECGDTMKEWLRHRTLSIRVVLDSAEQTTLDAIVATCK